MAEEKMTQEQIKALSFEEALAALEDIVRRLETGKVKLDEAVGAYEMGVLLKQQCESRLKDAKMRVEKIALTPDGTLSTTQLDAENA